MCLNEYPAPLVLPTCIIRQQGNRFYVLCSVITHSVYG